MDNLFSMTGCVGKKAISVLLLSAVLGLGFAGCGNPHANLSAEKALEEALHQVSGLRFDNAYDLFAVAEQKAKPGSEMHLKALFGKATCAHQRMPPSATNIAEATELYRRVIDEAPKSNFAARSMLALARIAEVRDYNGDKIDLNLARQDYEKVISTWPGQPVAGEATLRLGATFIQTYQEEQVRKGIAMLEEYLAAHPDDPLNSAFWQYLGDSYYIPLSKLVRDDEKQKQAYRKCLESYQKAEALGWMQRGRQGGIYWRMAVIADRYLHDAPLAAKYYGKIILETPNSGKAYESQLAIRRLNNENPNLNAPVPKINIFRNTEVIGQSSREGTGNHG